MQKNRSKVSYKIDRLHHEFLQLIDEIINYELSDDKVLGNAHVTDIDITNDLSYCKVYVEIVNGDKKEVLKGLNNAKGYVRHIIAEHLDLRKTPDFIFLEDETIEHSKRINELIDKINNTM